MPFRPRPPSPDPAARFRAIFGDPVRTGWVPAGLGEEQPAGPLEPAVERDVWPEVLPVGAITGWRPTASGAQVDAPSLRAQLPARPVPPPPVTSVLALLRAGRLDPGRRGALALALVGLLAAVVAGVVLLRSRPSEQSLAVPAISRPAGSPTAAPGGEVVVAVAGKVRHPGLVRLPGGSRVDDAVRAAGGVAPGASTGLVNLARKVLDGEQVLIGVDPPPAAAGDTGGSPAAAGAPAAGRLDLNAASASAFDSLPGIGPVLAERIVSWRTEHGRFASVDQLRQVSGIGESKYQQLKDRVRV